MKAPTTPFIAAALLCVLGLAACEALSGLSGERTLASPGTAATGTGGSGGAGASTGAGGEGGSGGTAGGPCVSKTYPPPPSSGKTGGTTTFVAALRAIDLGDLNADGSLGLDLDDRCTCLGDGPSCPSPSFATADHCDGPGGVDNGLARVFEFLSVLVGGTFDSANLSEQANLGEWSQLFRVRNYNGEDDDDQVEVAMYTSSGLENGGVAAWNGLDVFRIAASSIGPGGTSEDPAFVDPKAYVTGGVLVAALSKSAVTLTIGESEVAVDITAGLIQAEIVPVGGSFGLRKGIIAGRWRNADVFPMLSALRDGTGAPICQGQLLYDTLKDKICSNTDIRSTLGSPTDPCDALSMGIGFEADPAQLGTVDAPPMPLPGCAPEDDPILDACDL